MIIPPQFLAAGAAVALIAGFAGGWTVRDWKADSAALAAVKMADKERARLQAQVETQATIYEQERSDAAPRNVEREQALRVVFRDRVVPDSCAVPDVARQLLAEAVADANARASGQPGAAVPGASEPASAADRP